MKNKTLLRKNKINDNLDGWIFLLPMVVIVYLFIWRPTFIGGVLSFFDMKGYNVDKFCGFDNYRKVLMNSAFLPTFRNTIKYVLWSLIIGFLPPLIIATMLNEVIHFKNGFRSLIYIPAVIPGIAAMLMWYFIYYPDETGLLNMILAKFNLEPYTWLNDPKFSIIGIVIFSTWKGFPTAMLLYYSALQSISVEVYEAALIDGASPWKRFLNVTLPGMEGILLINLVRQIIAVFQIMQEPLAMTGGGPDGASTSLSYMLYQYGFNSGGRGTGSAMALGVIIFLILIVLTAFYFKLNKKAEERA